MRRQRGMQRSLQTLVVMLLHEDDYGAVLYGVFCSLGADQTGGCME